MELTVGQRLRHGWNAFWDRDSRTRYDPPPLGPSATYKPDRVRLNIRNERSILASVYTRIAMDVADLRIQHVRLDDNNRFDAIINSGLNECLTLDANIDQTGTAFIQDAVMSMLDEGSVALVPIDTTENPNITGSYDINSLRVGKVVQWYPRHVMVEVYNDRTGYKEQVTISKTVAAIIENPLYSVMNEPNSTLQRLIRKLNLLDAIDEQSGSGKLDIIIQLPYTIKTPARQDQAETRRKNIESQLSGSKYGIAYIDGTERVTQLNRPADNNLLTQIEYLTSMLWSQLGLTQSIFDGTADEDTLLNYYNRTIGPVVNALIEGMMRTFLTKTARSQKQALMYFRDPFKLIPVSKIAEIADKFTRNEILSPNEVRAIINYEPSKDPQADELRNRNLNQNKNGGYPAMDTEAPVPEET